MPLSALLFVFSWPALIAPVTDLQPVEFAIGQVTILGPSGTPRQWDTNTVDAIRRNGISDIEVDSPVAMRLGAYGYAGPADIGPELSFTLIWSGTDLAVAPDRVFLAAQSGPVTTWIARQDSLTAQVVAAVPRADGLGADLTIRFAGVLCQANDRTEPVEPCSPITGQVDSYFGLRWQGHGLTVTFDDRLIFDGRG